MSKVSIQELAAKLHSFRQLEPNWDGYGADKINHFSLGYASHIKDQLVDSMVVPVPDVFPVPNGNVQFEWQLGDIEVEVEVGSFGLCSVFILNNKTQESCVREVYYHSVVSSISSIIQRQPLPY